MIGIEIINENDMFRINGRIIKRIHDSGFTRSDIEYVSSIFIDMEEGEYQHLYIVSDDPIEIGDRYIIEDDADDDTIYLCHDNSVWPDGKRCKIIKTTHPELGVEILDQEDVERYIDFLSQ